jgi:hypothetical protein
MSGKEDKDRYTMAEQLLQNETVSDDTFSIFIAHREFIAEISKR